MTGLLQLKSQGLILYKENSKTFSAVGTKNVSVGTHGWIGALESKIAVKG